MPSPRDAYLETQVLTASPPKLRLMLIEGAMRFVQQTLHDWEDGQTESALESLIRAREIVGELMSSVEPQKSPLAQQTLAVYGFVARTLTEAQLEHSAGKLTDALRVLDQERMTWQELSQRQTISPPRLDSPTPALGHSPFKSPPLHQGISLEA